MENKKNFGKYIIEKRKEANLTQEELAKLLYVLPTTVSKWERGVSYPDITLVSSICKYLNISEHEFFIACDDWPKRKEEKKIKNIKKIKEYSITILNYMYIIAIIACFICNLIINRTLLWSLIVLIAVLMLFALTGLQKNLKKDKHLPIKILLVETILTYIELYVISFVTKEISLSSTWLLGSFVVASFEFILIWIGVLATVYLKTNKKIKIGIWLIILAIATIFSNPICSLVFEIEEVNNIGNILSAIALIIIAIKLFLAKESSKN